MRMKTLVAGVLVIGTFVLHGLILKDIWLHLGPGDHFRILPIIAAVWMIAAFIGSWAIVLWDRRDNHWLVWLREGLPLFGMVVWVYFFATAGMRESIEMPLFFGVVILMTYSFVRLIRAEDLSVVMLHVYPWLALVGVVLAGAVIVNTSEISTSGVLSFVIVPAVLLMGVFFWVGFPSVIVLYPFYLWALGHSPSRPFSFRGSAVWLVPLSMLLASNYVHDAVMSLRDPCFSVKVEGKGGGGTFVHDGRVCASRNLTQNLIEYRTLEGADPAMYQTDEEGSSGARAVPVVKSTPTRGGGGRLQQNVPFTSQAPLANWKQISAQESCEEASALMVSLWASGTDSAVLLPERAENQLESIRQYEKTTFGSFADLSSEDMRRLLMGYFVLKHVDVREVVSKQDILSMLQDDAVVLVPVDGRELHNPSYFAGGPERHMLVVIGVDSVTGQFITNDPGTIHGNSYRYDQDVLFEAIRGYPTGDTLPLPITPNKSVVVVNQN